MVGTKLHPIRRLGRRGSWLGLVLVLVLACGKDSPTDSPVPVGSVGVTPPTLTVQVDGSGSLRATLRDGQAGEYGSATRVGGSYTYVALSSGSNESHLCGIVASGDAYCWGSNTYGELGDSTTTAASSDAPVLVAGGHAWADLTRGTYHTCGITTAGDLYCWGRNDRGQLAVGSGSAGCDVYQFPCIPDVPESSVPLPAATGQTFVPGTLSSDGQGSCALGSDGNGYCWGNLGALGGIPGGWSPAMTAVGPSYTDFTGSLFRRCGLDEDGNAWCTASGDNPSVLNPP